MRQKWTAKDEAILRRYYPDYDMLSSLLGRKKTLIVAKAFKMDIVKARVPKTRWTVKDVDMLRRYYPDYDTLVRLLKRDSISIKNKAFRMGLRKREPKAPRISKPALSVAVETGKSERKIALIADTGEYVKMHRPSYREAMREMEYLEDKALIALTASTGSAEWTRCLDEYRNLVVRREKLIENKRYYSE